MLYEDMVYLLQLLTDSGVLTCVH